MERQLNSTQDSVPSRAECVAWAKHWIDLGKTVEIMTMMDNIYGIDDPDGFADIAMSAWFWIANVE